MLANKLKTQHVEWHRKKEEGKIIHTNVKKFCSLNLDFIQSDLHKPKFECISSTSYFIKIFDKLFVILQSQSTKQNYSSTKTIK